MLPFHVVVELELRAARAAELERKLTMARLIREGQVHGPSWRTRLLLRLADALIGLGQSIQPRVRTA